MKKFLVVLAVLSAFLIAHISALDRPGMAASSFFKTKALRQKFSSSDSKNYKSRRTPFNTGFSPYKAQRRMPKHAPKDVAFPQNLERGIATINGSLAGAAINCFVIEQPPYVRIVGPADGGRVVQGAPEVMIEGWFFQFMEELRSVVGFNVSYFQTGVGFDGSLELLGPLDDPNVIHTGAIVSVNSERAANNDYTLSYVQNGFVIITQEDAVDNLNFGFFNPFSGATWILITLTVAVYGPIMWCLEGDQNWKRSRKDDSYKGRKGLGNAVFDGVLTFSAQGPKFVPRTALGRGFSSCFQFVSLVVIATYTADLTADLSNQQPSTQIQSMEDLAGVTVGVVGGSITADFLEQNLNQPIDDFPTIESLLEAVRNGDVVAAIEEDTSIEFFLLTSPNCRLTVVDQAFNLGGWALPFQRDLGTQTDEISLELSDRILELQESGFLASLDEQFIISSDPDSACINEQEEIIAAGVPELGGLFFLFFLLLIGVCCFHFIVFPSRKYAVKYYRNGCELVWPWQLPNDDDDEEEEDKETEMGEKKDDDDDKFEGFRTIGNGYTPFLKGITLPIDPSVKALTFGVGYKKKGEDLTINAILSVFSASETLARVNEEKPSFEDAITLYQVGEDEEDVEKSAVQLEKLPSEVQSIVFSLNANPNFGKHDDPYFRVVDDRGVTIAKHSLSTYGSYPAFVACVLRPSPNGWLLAAVLEPHKDMKNPAPELAQRSYGQIVIERVEGLSVNFDEVYVSITHHDQRLKTTPTTLERNFVVNTPIHLEKREAPIIIRIRMQKSSGPDETIGTYNTDWASLKAGDHTLKFNSGAKLHIKSL